MLAKKQKTPRDKKYLEWVRSLTSIVSDSNQYIVAHHVRCFGWGGMGLKPSDYRVVPLTHQEHADLHNHGEKEFWESHGVDPRAHVAAQMMVYLREVLMTPLTRDQQDHFALFEWEEMILELENYIGRMSGYRQ